MSGNVAGQADMIAILRAECAQAGGVRAWARAKEFSPGTVFDVLSGRRDVSEAVANALGFVREVRFRPLSMGRAA
jgi:hypothetical protein